MLALALLTLLPAALALPYPAGLTERETCPVTWKVYAVHYSCFQQGRHGCYANPQDDYVETPCWDDHIMEKSSLPLGYDQNRPVCELKVCKDDQATAVTFTTTTFNYPTPAVTTTLAVTRYAYWNCLYADSCYQWSEDKKEVIGISTPTPTSSTTTKPTTNKSTTIKPTCTAKNGKPRPCK